MVSAPPRGRAFTGFARRRCPTRAGGAARRAARASDQRLAAMSKIHAAACAALMALSAGALAQVVRIDPATDKPKADLSAKPRTGKASFYANFFGGRTMADGTPMRLDGDNAASRTLPLGTVARVTNLANGQSAVVTIRDRG